MTDPNRAQPGVARRRVLQGAAVGAAALTVGGGPAWAAPAEPAAPAAGVPGTPPTGEKVFNVREAPYNAAGDGRTDDTAAIRQAVEDILTAKQANFPNVRSTGHHTLYFPTGVYRVSEPLSFGGKVDDVTTLQMMLHIVGDGPTRSILRLAGGVLTDPAAPKPLVDLFDFGGANNLFCNTVADIGFHTEPGNPGAIGLRYHNNNVGSIRRVHIVSGDRGGVAGLDLGTKLAGIGVVRDLTVVGFDHGVLNRGEEHCGYVMEGVTTIGQKVAGVRSLDKGLWVRGLRSVNSVPAVSQGGGGGQVVLLDSHLAGGGGGEPAISNEGGWLFARNVGVYGYGTSVRDGSEEVKGKVAEYATGGARRLFDDAPATSVGLPIEDVPSFPDLRPEDWAVVEGTDGAAIQAAIDSGRPGVFLPRGSYTTDTSIRIRGAVTRISGDWSRVAASQGAAGRDYPMFVVEDGPGKPLLIEEIDSGFGPTMADTAPFFQVDSTRPLVLRDLFLPWGPAYRQSVEGGKLFIDGLCSGGPRDERTIAGWEFVPGQKVWARHFNHEGVYPHVHNRGADLFVLGFKFGESHGPYVLTTDGGRTELLGGIFNTLSKSRPAEDVGVINDNSDVSVVALERSTTRQGAPMAVTVREIRGTETRDLPSTDLPLRQGWDLISPVVPLYRGRSV